MFTTLPKAVADKLGLTEVTRRTVRTASGEEVLPESYVTIHIMGEKTTTPILVSESRPSIALWKGRGLWWLDKADTARFSVSPVAIPMEGFLGFLGAKNMKGGSENRADDLFS